VSCTTSASIAPTSSTLRAKPLKANGRPDQASGAPAQAAAAPEVAGLVANLRTDPRRHLVNALALNVFAAASVKLASLGSN
jgi:hypothetical protein